MQSSEIARLRNQVEGWDRRSIKPRVLDVSRLSLRLDADIGVRSRARDLAAVIPVRGSIVVFYGSADNGIIAELSKAIREEDEHRLSAIGSEARSSFRGLPTLTESNAIDEASAAKYLFDVKYAGKTAAGMVGLNRGMRLATATLSYVGGPTVPDDFEIVEYRRQPSGPGLDYLIALRAPILTYLERAMLDKIPHEQLEVTVGVQMAEDTFQQVADVAKQMVEEVKQEAQKNAARQKGRGNPTPQFTNILNDLDQLLQSGRISPTETAKRLMQARQDLLFRSLQRL